MRLDVFLTNGRFIVVNRNTEAVLDDILYSKDQFVEITDKDGTLHYVSIDHIVEAKVIEHPLNRGFDE